MRGIEAVLEVLHASGVHYIFGNPGSTELPLNDAMAGDRRFQYVLGLHELPVTAMADGYAMASGQLGVVCLHTCSGLGNAMGMLYNAYCEGTPLLVLAGQQDRRLLFEEPLFAGDMVSVTRPWTKWSAQVMQVEDLPATVRRAVKTALVAPSGPVFLSVPVDIQLEQRPSFDLHPPQVPDKHLRPPLDALKTAAEKLARADCPVILAGSRVVEAGAIDDLVTVAEILGAEVFSDHQITRGRLPMPGDHPLYAGGLPFGTAEIGRCLSQYDVILAVGMDLFRLFTFGNTGCPVPNHVSLIQLDADPWQIGKNCTVEIGLQGDPKVGLAELAQRLSETRTAERKHQARKRVEDSVARRLKEREALIKEIDDQKNKRPMTALTLMGAVARVLPSNTAVVLEAVTTDNGSLEKLGVLKDPTGQFGHRGWTLGWGLGCAIGVKLAWPERPAVAILGDGAALYGIQGLWTAAHYCIPVVFLIANNRQYKTLRMTAEMMSLSGFCQQDYPATDLLDPEIDFVGLARAFGVEAHRVTEPDDLSQRLDNGLSRTSPLLLDVTIER